MPGPLQARFDRPVGARAEAVQVGGDGAIGEVRHARANARLELGQGEVLEGRRGQRRRCLAMGLESVFSATPTLGTTPVRKRLKEHLSGTAEILMTIDDCVASRGGHIPDEDVPVIVARYKANELATRAYGADATGDAEEPKAKPRSSGKSTKSSKGRSETRGEDDEDDDTRTRSRTNRQQAFRILQVTAFRMKLTRMRKLLECLRG